MSSIVDLLGGEVLNGDKQKVEVSSFTGESKVIGLYFSAHWCPPCRGFTPVLAEFYNKMKSSGRGLEIVFISSDGDEAQWSQYFAEMPWLALPYEDRDRKESISDKFGVSGIPMFVLLDGATGDVINANARMNVVGDPEGANFPWKN